MNAPDPFAALLDAAWPLPVHEVRLMTQEEMDARAAQEHDTEGEE